LELLKTFKNFEHLGRPERYFALLLLSGLLLALCVIFQQTRLNPLVRKILEMEERELIYNFAYYDWLLYIFLGTFLLFVFSVFLPLPGKDSRYSKISKWLPTLGFLAFFAISFLALIYIPFLLFKAGNPFVKDAAPLFDKELYLKSAAALSLILGVHAADCFFQYQKTRWWYFLFLINMAFPILWWNVMAGLFPSRLWKIWRLPLLGISCLMPILYFLSQPQLIGDKKDLSNSVLAKVKAETIYDLRGYQIEKVPGKNEIYVNAGYLLIHFKLVDGTWRMAGIMNPGIRWDEASFDWNLNVAYIYNGDEGILSTVDLQKMEFRSSFLFSNEFFPEKNDGIHQVFFLKNNFMVIAENKGRIVIFDLSETKEKKSILYRPENLEIWRIKPGLNEEMLYVLHQNRLSILSIDDLSIIRSVKFGGRAVDMILDRKNSQVLVSFPRLMEVMAFNSNSLALEKRIMAPAAVRSMAIDNENDLYIFASYGGSVEIRSMENGKLIRRARLLPFIRRIAVFPDSGRLIATSGRYPIIDWKYLAMEDGTTITERLTRTIESLFKFFFIDNLEGTEEGWIGPVEKRYSHGERLDNHFSASGK